MRCWGCQYQGREVNPKPNLSGCALTYLLQTLVTVFDESYLCFLLILVSLSANSISLHRIG